jgi:hypothetical protein
MLRVEVSRCNALVRAMNDPDAPLMTLVRAIVGGDRGAVSRLLAAQPALASASFVRGATRQAERPYYLDEVERYVMAGDTASHLAAACYRDDFVRALIDTGADVRARNRRGAEPLHAAAVGRPGSHAWNRPAQAATIALLIVAGADPDAVDASGVTPLHRAVRTRCAAAVHALLDAGADAQRLNRNGSTPVLLASQNTGRGGTGSPQAKAQQQEILRLLAQYGAKPR